MCDLNHWLRMGGGRGWKEGRKEGTELLWGHREDETLKRKIKNKHLREWTLEGALEQSNFCFLCHIKWQEVVF